MRLGCIGIEQRLMSPMSWRSWCNLMEMDGCVIMGDFHIDVIGLLMVLAGEYMGITCESRITVAVGDTSAHAKECFSEITNLKQQWESVGAAIELPYWHAFSTLAGIIEEAAAAERSASE